MTRKLARIPTRADHVRQLIERPIPVPLRLLTAVAVCAIPVEVWSERGALFGIVALLTFPPLILLGLFARDWLLKPRPPGPRALAPLGPLPIVPMAFVLFGWLTELSPLVCLLIGLAIYLPMALQAVICHPSQ
ncbi:hypothetical protein OJ997_18405 [Solirubrobacter phytolaccae]|uniref:Uncharacterized protein n=1 Tax=Solirubrobacter phytolaccae TaxID=1404360 RepID=A0A9X3SCA1_9ACTN|nr:hypothetical protein [Solirubrobacter phytolaccae]MDA0182285.1 hypothetical protein [Solirubrobacter phytolaccae]